MLPAFGVGTGVAGGTEHNRNTFVLIENSARQIAGDNGVIVGMRNHEQDVSFIAFVGSRDLGDGNSVGEHQKEYKRVAGESFQFRSDAPERTADVSSALSELPLIPP